MYKNYKIFRNIFNQKVKGLCNENEKTLIKEIMEHSKKMKDTPCS